MSRRLWRLSILVLAGVAVAAVMSTPWQQSRDPAVAEAVAELEGQWVGREAEDFDLPDLRGRQQSLRDFRGQVVFLNFWASYCKPCIREMPSMERLAREYQDRGMEMVAVSLDPERANARRFLSRFLSGQRSAMTVLWDPESEVSTQYGTERIPETYIIDRQGEIVARFVNAYDWSRPEVKKLVESLMS